MPKASARRPAPVADAISLLEQDHAAADELLELLVQMTAAGRNRERVVFVLTEELWIHLQVEEELFFPALARGGPGLSDGDLARQAVKQALSQLEQCNAEGFAVVHLAKRVHAFHELLRADEERHLFPLARRLLSEPALVALGDRMRARQKELRQSGLVRRDATSVTSTRSRYQA